MIIEPPSDDPLIGTMINGYRVMQTIGRGGMGAVYRAVQPTIDAEVAIKVLGDELAREPEAVERFIAEAKMANLVRHEGLVKVIGLGVLPDGRPYQIMEHLTGLPLSSVIHPDIPLGTLCMRLAEALRAIGAMHARGIIHRDLKPANLFVTTAGYIKVLDFGIAKLAHTSGLTRTGHAIGTPEYMSPEQAEAAAIDHRSDIYSMGIVVYECVTGVRPFEGRVVEAMVLRERPPRVEPASLDAIVQTAMAADPRDRFADAEAMACALERAADGLPEGSLLENPTTSAPPPTPATLAPSEAAPTVVAKPSALPARLGRYVIEGLVGRGAHGQVLVAHDPRVERKVALKLVSARGSERERVLAEARAMAKVNHPNVVTLFELGEDGDHVFLAMEYLDAIDLEGWLAAEPRAWDAIVARFVEAGRGLAAAHAAGVVHRDFKPANVLVAGDGRAKVGDFGIARADGTTDVAQGTVGYMAPEQLEGGTVDPRADQFAFAAALWHALHHELPYGDGDLSAVAYALAVHRGELRAPANREIPAAINAVMRRALAAQPDARFPSMTALLAELAPRARRRWPVIAVLALVVTAGAAFAIAHRHSARPMDRAGPVSSLAEIAALHTGSEQLRALAALPETERHSEAARVLAGRAALDGYVRTMTLPEPAIGPLTISTTGATVGVLLEHGVWIYDVATAAAHQLALPTSKISALYVDEKQHVVRAAVADGIVQAPVAGGAWTTVLQCKPRSPDELAYDRALRVIACDQLDGDIVHAIDSAAFPVDLSGKLSLSGDGTRLYAVSMDQTVVTSTSVTGSHVVAKHTVPEGAQLLFGNQVLAIITAHAAAVWDPETDDVATWEDPNSEAIALSSLIEGAQPRLALATGTRSSYLVAITRAPLGLALTSMVKDPPQRILAAGSRLVELFATSVTVDSPEQLTSWSLPGAPGLVTAAAAGDRIALLDDRTLRIWDVSLREPVIIPAQQVTRNGNESWFAVRADDHLRWYTIDPQPALVAETPVPQPTKFVSSAVAQTAFFADQTGTWLWRPPAPPRRITTKTGFTRIYDIGGVLVGLDHDHLVDVVDNTPRCNDLRVAAVAVQGIAVVFGTPQQLCIVATDKLVALEDVPRDLGVLWEFTADGALVIAHNQAHAGLFDTRTGAAIPEPALDAIASPNYVEGTRDQLVVAARDGIFVLSPTRTRRLEGPSPLRSFEYVRGPEAFVIQDNQISAIDLATGAHRLVGRTSVANSMMPMIYAYDHALGIHEAGRDVFAVWSIDPPTIAETERLLSRVN